MQAVECRNAGEERHGRDRLLSAEGAEQAFIGDDLQTFILNPVDRLEGAAQRMAGPDALRKAVFEADQMGKGDTARHARPSGLSTETPGTMPRKHLLCVKAFAQTASVTIAMQRLRFSERSDNKARRKRDGAYGARCSWPFLPTFFPA